MNSFLDDPVFPDDPVRSFVALPCPSGLNGEIETALRDWRRLDAAVKWADPSKLHLTLRFLGDASPEKLRGLHRRLRESVAASAPILLRAGSTGAFPGWNRPRVLWLGLEDSGSLERLAETVESAARAAGFEAEERPFRPHLTLGRVKGRRGVRGAVEAIRSWRPETAPEEVEEAILYRSELTPDGAIHSAMARYELGGER